MFTLLSSYSVECSWLKPAPENHYKASIILCRKTPSCLANAGHNPTRKATMAEKLSKQLRQPQCHRLLQEPWKCGRDCRLSSKSALILPKPQILAASGSLEGGPHSPGSQTDKSSHVTKFMLVESDNVQNLPLPHGLGFGGCQLCQGHTQWSNKKESGTSLVMLLIGICLPMQWRQFDPWSRRFYMPQSN